MIIKSGAEMTKIKTWKCSKCGLVQPKADAQKVAFRPGERLCGAGHIARPA
jgi:hypothetical protein